MDVLSSYVAENTSRAMNSTIFLSRVAIELSSTSPFLEHIGCDEGVALGVLIGTKCTLSTSNLCSDFRDKTHLLFDRIINWWKERTISSAISRYDAKFSHFSLSGQYFCHQTAGRFIDVSQLLLLQGPSPAMMESLHALSTSLHNLGLTHHPSLLIKITPSLLGLFIVGFTRSMSDRDTDQSLQTLNDATFLRCIALTWSPEALVTSSLDDLIAALRLEVRILRYHCDVTSQQGFTGSSARPRPSGEAILDKDSDVAFGAYFTFLVYGTHEGSCR